MGHGWTRIHTDKKRLDFYLCESVFICGQTCFCGAANYFNPTFFSNATNRASLRMLSNVGS